MHTSKIVEYVSFVYRKLLFYSADKEDPSKILFFDTFSFETSIMIYVGLISDI